MNRDLLAKELELEEGFVPHAYQDSLDFWTIGIGRMIDKRRGGGITREEGLYLLKNDIEKTFREISSALPWFWNLSDARQRALCNMAFQMGMGNAGAGTGLLGFQRSLALIRDGKYGQAANALLESKWAKEQTPARARRIADMIRKG